MKVLCLALLLTLACQLRLPDHYAANILAGNSFSIDGNCLSDSRLNGVVVSFTATTVSFKLDCGDFTTTYTVMGINTITFSTDWNPIRTNCANNNPQTVL